MDRMWRPGVHMTFIFKGRYPTERSRKKMDSNIKVDFTETDREMGRWVLSKGGV